MVQVVNCWANASEDILAGIFSGGEIGDLWRFDAANTDASALDDEITEAVGLVNGLLLTDPDPANTPNLKLSSGHQSALFDGSGDRLQHNFGSPVAQPGTIIVALDNVSTATHVIVTGSGASSRWQISNDSSDNIIAFAGSTLDSTFNSPIGAKVLAVEFNGASSRFRRNGTTTASGNPGAQSTGQLTIGALYDGTFGGSFYAFSLFFIDRLLTTDELDYVEALMGSHGGITW